VGAPLKYSINPGDQYGYLTVLGEAERNHRKQRVYRCVCVCLKEKLVVRSDLTSGATKSCGCKRYPVKHDLLGKKFGKWTVIGRTKRGLRRVALWVVKCDCGKERLHRSDQLLSGRSASCGCGYREKKQERARRNRRVVDGVPSSYLRNLKARVTRFGRQHCDLTLEEIAAQYVKQNKLCYFSGIPIKFDTENIEKYQRHEASIDRLDSKGHYTASNIVIVHKDINSLKTDFTAARFIELCHLVAANHPLPSNEVSPLETPLSNPVTVDYSNITPS